MNSNLTNMKNETKGSGSKSSKLKILLYNILAMAVVAFAVPCFVLMWLDDYTKHNQTIEVPDICGMQIEHAADVLRNSALDFEIVDHKYSKGVDENVVLEQRPSAGSDVKEGRKIQLTMSTGKVPTRPVPDIIDNCSLREAEARLRAAGFKLSPHKEVAGEDEWVYHLLCGNDTLENGMYIAIGSTLTLVIGSGDVTNDSIQEPVLEESWFE